MLTNKSLRILNELSGLFGRQGIKHAFLCTGICWSPKEVLKTEPEIHSDKLIAIIQYVDSIVVLMTKLEL